MFAVHGDALLEGATTLQMDLSSSLLTGKGATDHNMAKDRFFNLKVYPEAYPSPGDSPLEGEKTRMGETETPLLDIYENHDSIVIEVDLPGINPKQIEVLLENNQVVIEGHRGERGEGQGAGNYLRMERCFEDFKRIIPLPIAVDQRQAEGQYRDGILVLRFPKISDRRNQTIKIDIK